MSASNVIVPLMIAALWLVALTSGQRNWRAIAFLGLVTTGLLAGGWLPTSVSPWARALLWDGAALILLLRGDLLSPMSEKEYRFVQQYLSARRRLRALKGRALKTESADYIAAFSKIIGDLESLTPPQGEWASLRSDAVAELQRRLTIMRLAVTPPTAALEAADAQWADIEQRLASLVRRRAGLWAN
jgi:hypothetical protein